MNNTFYNTCLKISKNALKEFEDIKCSKKVNIANAKKVKLCMKQ